MIYGLEVHVLPLDTLRIITYLKVSTPGYFAWFLETYWTTADSKPSCDEVRAALGAVGLYINGKGTLAASVFAMLWSSDIRVDSSVLGWRPSLVASRLEAIASRLEVGWRGHCE